APLVDDTLHQISAPGGLAFNFTGTSVVVYGASQDSAQASCAIDGASCAPYAQSSGTQVIGDTASTGVVCACTRLSSSLHTLRLVVAPANGATLAVDYIEFSTAAPPAVAVVQQDKRVLGRDVIHDSTSNLETITTATIIPDSGTGSFPSPVLRTVTFDRRGSRLSPVAGSVVVAISTFSLLGIVLLTAFTVWRWRRRKQRKQRQDQQQRTRAMIRVVPAQQQPYSAGSTAVGSPLAEKDGKFAASDASHDDVGNSSSASQKEEARAHPESVDNGIVLSAVRKGRTHGRKDTRHVRWTEAEAGTREIAAAARNGRGRAPPPAANDGGRVAQSTASEKRGRDMGCTRRMPAVNVSAEAGARMRDTVASLRTRRTMSAPILERIPGISEAAPTLAALSTTVELSDAPKKGQRRADVRVASSGPRAGRAKYNTAEKAPPVPEKDVCVVAAALDDVGEVGDEPTLAETVDHGEKTAKRSQGSASPHWFLSYAEEKPLPSKASTPAPEHSPENTAKGDRAEDEATVETTDALRPASINSGLSYVPSSYNHDAPSTRIDASEDGHARRGASPTSSVAMSTVTAASLLQRATPRGKHAPSAFPAGTLGMEAIARRAMRAPRRAMSPQSVLSSGSSILSAPPAPPPQRGLPPTPRPRPTTARQVTGRSQSQESGVPQRTRQGRSPEAPRSLSRPMRAPSEGWI
ncbi:hypothetical protein HYPSUDRAFT_539130, partial [Hypholoma sublateritium FD-334 SS-4]